MEQKAKSSDLFMSAAIGFLFSSAAIGATTGGAHLSLVVEFAGVGLGAALLAIILRWTGR